MPRSAMTTLARVTIRQFAPRTAIRSSSLSTKAVQPATRSTKTALLIQNFNRRSPFSTTVPIRKGLSPETDNPQPKEAEPHSATASVPVELSMEEYNELSDEYMDTLLMKLEALAEEEEAVDAEYSAGVLTITHANGTYVINKQPPNKQIWLSSPLSGPKRYDFVIASEGQDAKEGTGSGEWVYLRDGSTLNELLRDEVGVEMVDDI